MLRWSTVDSVLQGASGGAATTVHQLLQGLNKKRCYTGRVELLILLATRATRVRRCCCQGWPAVPQVEAALLRVQVRWSCTSIFQRAIVRRSCCKNCKFSCARGDQIKETERKRPGVGSTRVGKDKITLTVFCLFDRTAYSAPIERLSIRGLGIRSPGGRSALSFQERDTSLFCSTGVRLSVRVYLLGFN
jgi:hypothetical protein